MSTAPASASPAHAHAAAVDAAPAHAAAAPSPVPPDAAGAPGAATPAAAAPRRSPARVLVPLVLVLALLGGGYVAAGWGKVTTDNAQVEGHVVVVGPRVAGTIASVVVSDNQAVKAGDPLVQLDDGDQKVRLAVAEADLLAAAAARDAAQAQLQALSGGTAAMLDGAAAGVDAARAAASGSESAVAQARAALESAKARADQAAADRARAEGLLASGGLTKQAYDGLLAADAVAQATLAQATAGLEAAEQNVTAARGRYDEARARYAQATTGDAQVSAAAAQVRAAEARVQQATANVEGARLQLAYTTVVAPFDAIVARRSAEPGQVVAPGSGLVGLVGTNEVWVTANFKETQVADMAPGQEVDVEVDGVSGRTFPGRVQGLSGATGARFSLLPPDNASGNFTKVIQRVPVRVDLGPEALGVLRPGMSAEVTVRVK